MNPQLPLHDTEAHDALVLYGLEMIGCEPFAVCLVRRARKS